MRDLTFEEVKLVSGAGKDGSEPDENSKKWREQNHAQAPQRGARANARHRTSSN
jgi:hypothetical protein